MPLQQNVSTEIRYAPEVTWGTAPGASTTAQSLRRVSSTLSLNRDSFQSAEVSLHRQLSDMRLGTRRAQGDISGEMSPGTYADFVEAWTRGTWAATTSITEATGAMSSATLSVSSNVVTASAGSFITAGLKIGDVVRFTEGFAAGNLNKNLRVTSLTSTTMTVVGATLSNEAGPISTYTIATPGKKVMPPASGHTNRSFAVEINYSDIDTSELYTGCRVGRMQFGLPASGMSSFLVGLAGKDMSILSGASAPYYTGTVTSPTSTGILAAVNGSLLLNGTAISVVTGLEFTCELSPQSDAVVGSNTVSEIFLGRNLLTGNLTALLEDSTYISAFLNETEISLAVQLNVDSSANSDFFSIFLPRVKLSSATVQRQGDGGIPVSFAFQALKKATTTGFDASTVIFQDSTL